jgi:thioredoxin
VSGLEELSAEAIDEALGSESRGVLLDFWSPWCAPCRVLKPHLAKLAGERVESWRFIAVNSESEPAFAQRLNVHATPTLILFKNGEEQFRFAGTPTISSVEEKLDELR